jgi:hypothetical protein
MDAFNTYLKTCGDRFVIVDDYRFVETPSKLLNESIFAKKWYMFSNEHYNIFDRKFEECSKPTSQCNYVVTNFEDIGSVTVNFSLFIETVLNDEEDEDYENCENYSENLTDNIKKIREMHIDKIKQYVSENELNNWYAFLNDGTFNMGINYDDEINDTVLKDDWYCFLHFHDADYHMRYWLININPNCALYEYVIYCEGDGSWDLKYNTDFYHFSDIEKKLEPIKEFCEW